MAQQVVIIPSAASPTFPGCALSCSILQQAQNVCLPPNQPTNTQLVYDQCFCNSALLSQLKTSTEYVCITECAIQTDRQLLQAWYNNFCALVVTGVDPTTQTAAAPVGTQATSTVTATSGTAVATVTATSTPGSSSQGQKTQENKSWIDTHWKYILMIVIIIVGLALLAWLAVWLRRRHRRKLEAQRAAASGFNYDAEKKPASDPKRSATPDLWGPHQMMQATNGYGYASEAIPATSSRRSSKKYRGTESAKRERDPHDTIDEITEADRPAVVSRPSNKRARPSELEINARMIGAADRRSKTKGKSRSSSQQPKDKAIEADHEDVSVPERKEVDPEKT